MNRGVRRAQQRACALLIAAGLGAAACSSSATPTATPGETAVCGKLQSMAGKLERGDRVDALGDFTALNDLTAASGNETMVREGSALFGVLSKPVDNYQDLTIQQTQEVGNKALADSSAHLGALADECVRVGQPVQLTSSLR